MAIKFQYNKTALNELDKKLKARTRALPTIKNKESALRMEVKRAKADAERMDAALDAKMREMEGFSRLFTEFRPDLIKVVSESRCPTVMQILALKPYLPTLVAKSLSVLMIAAVW